MIAITLLTKQSKNATKNVTGLANARLCLRRYVSWDDDEKSFNIYIHTR